MYATVLASALERQGWWYSHIQCSMDSTRLFQGSLVNLIKHDILELKKGMVQ